MRIADFGCGRTGHIVFPAAAFLKPSGVVYAVDIMKDVLEEVRKRSALEGLANIHTVWADVERVGMTAIPPRTLDIVFLINLLIHSKARGDMLREAARLLKDKGRLAIVEWTEARPPLVLRDSTLVNFTDIVGWGEESGFVVQDDFTAGKYHRGLILYKHD